MAACTGSAGLVDSWERDLTDAQPQQKVNCRRIHTRQLSAIDYLEGESDLLLKVWSTASQPANDSALAAPAKESGD